jgi:hypothetical protein
MFDTFAERGQALPMGGPLYRMTTTDLCRAAIAVRCRQRIEYSTTGAAPTPGTRWIIGDRAQTRPILTEFITAGDPRP